MDWLELFGVELRVSLDAFAVLGGARPGMKEVKTEMILLDHLNVI